MNQKKSPCTPHLAYRDIDESKLGRTDRLCLAYWRLNRYEWDDIVGPKPEGFDVLPDWLPDKAQQKRKKLRRRGCSLPPMSKSDHVGPPMRTIRSIVGEANLSRCLWVYFRGKTEEEWLQWYLNERFIEQS